jgi:hypothetical protein
MRGAGHGQGADDDEMQRLDGLRTAGHAFVVFGTNGGLAEVMTFHSLYKLEDRGLLGTIPSLELRSTLGQLINCRMRAPI